MSAIAMKTTETSGADELRQAHAALLQDLRSLDEAVRPTTGEGLAQLLERLGATRTHISAHFRFEEQNGYMDVVRKREPRLERAIQHLIVEHQQITQTLDALVEQAMAMASPTATFREKARGWIERVRRHEAHENDLIQDAFNLVIGGED